MPDIVKVTNVGSEPLSGMFDSEPYFIAPGDTAMLDVECAKKDFGDWTIRNYADEDKKFRTEEYRRIRGQRGVMEGSRVPTGELDSDGRPIEVPADVLLDKRLPKVDIELMDGSKVVTVIDDPEGKSLPPQDVTQLDQARAIESMQEQMQKMQDMIDALKNPAPQVNIPKDSPVSERPRRQKPAVVGSQVSE